MYRGVGLMECVWRRAGCPVVKNFNRDIRLQEGPSEDEKSVETSIILNAQLFS